MTVYQVFTRLFGADNRGLGCTHIWYTGIIEHASKTDYSAIGIAADNTDVVKGEAGSPYAIRDYYDVDPDLAKDPKKRIREFELLVERTHKAGLKVIIDFVPNHVARQYHSDAKPIGVRDLGQDDDKTCSFSPDNNFYYIDHIPPDTVNANGTIFIDCRNASDFSDSTIQRWVRANLPLPMRKLLPRGYFESRLGRISEKIRADFYENLEKEKNEQISERMVADISGQIEECLIKMAKVVEIPLG